MFFFSLFQYGNNNNKNIFIHPSCRVHKEIEFDCHHFQSLEQRIEVVKIIIAESPASLKWMPPGANCKTSPPTHLEFTWKRLRIWSGIIKWYRGKNFKNLICRTRNVYELSRLRFYINREIVNAFQQGY